MKEDVRKEERRNDDGKTAGRKAECDNWVNVCCGCTKETETWKETKMMKRKHIRIVSKIMKNKRKPGEKGTKWEKTKKNRGVLTR